MKAEGCVFCAIVAGDEGGHVVYRDERVAAFLDRVPLLPGHTLAVTVDHFETIEDLPEALVGPFFVLTRRLSVAFGPALGADGSFIGVNTRISQSVAHLHAHVVPRRRGDRLFSQRMMWRRQRYEAGEAEKIAAGLRSALERAPA